MKVKTLLMLLTILAVAATFSYAQETDWNLIGAGARARGMGGAFIGTADDATAASWNPAGLARLEKPEASFVGIYTTVAQTMVMNWPYAGYDNKEEDLDPQLDHFTVNFLSGAFPLKVGERNLVTSINWQRTMDFYYYKEDKSENYTYKTEGGLDAITPAFGIQLTPLLSLGTAVNIYTGKITDKVEYRNEEEKSETTYSGLNFNIGALADFNKLRLGVVYKTPYTLTMEDDNNNKSEIEMPGILGLGAALQATDNLTLALDFEMRPFSEMKFDGEKSEFEDVNQLRFGAEYLFFMGQSIVPLRLGFRTDAKPYRDLMLNITGMDANDFYGDTQYGDQVVGGVFTLGAGLIMGNINLDFAIEIGGVKETVEMDMSNVYDYDSGNYYDFGVFKTETTTNITNFIFAIVYHFGED